jgi:hypothetical protein
MSIELKTSDGSGIEARVTQILQGQEVRIGEYEMSLEEFAGMATHLLVGGLFGWMDQVTPEPINQALSTIFEMYEKTSEGVWTRKKKHQPGSMN